MGTKKFVSNNFSVDASGLHAENSKRFVLGAKRQATSGKLPNNFSFIKFPVSRDERLY